MNDDICMTCGCVNGGHFNCYTALESALAAMTAERDGLKEELKKADEVWIANMASLKQELIGHIEKEKSRAERMEKDLKETIRWMAQTIHQAYHEKDTFRECSKNTCDAAREALDDGKGVAR